MAAGDSFAHFGSKMRASELLHTEDGPFKNIALGCFVMTQAIPSNTRRDIHRLLADFL